MTSRKSPRISLRLNKENSSKLTVQFISDDDVQKVTHIKELRSGYAEAAKKDTETTRPIGKPKSNRKSKKRKTPITETVEEEANCEEKSECDIKEKEKCEKPRGPRIETLPPEMVLKISGNLTPQDLARCCGVCRDWHEIFNDDCHWRPRCDQQLAEYLRNTPSVVEPVFVTPEATNDTLTPICFWRLAFMRENHLWKNWEKGNHKEGYGFKTENEFRRDFLTNTLVVIWCYDRIEIWDISVIPVLFVMKTDPSVDLGDSYYLCFVASSSVLLVEQLNWIKVFHVDVLNKRVELRHTISVNEARQEILSRDETKTLCFVKESTYVRVTPGRSSFEIIDLETGEKLRSERCPAVGNGNGIGNSTIYEIKSFITSDIAIVKICVCRWRDTVCLEYRCYDIRQLTFLQGPEMKTVSDFDDVAIHKHYLAFVDGSNGINTLKIYNLRTSEVLYEQIWTAFDISTYVFNNRFIFMGSNKRSKQSWIEMFSLSDGRSTTILRKKRRKRITLKTINNKMLIALHGDDDVAGLWIASGGNVVQSNYPIRPKDKFNQTFTRGLLWWWSHLFW